MSEMERGNQAVQFLKITAMEEITMSEMERGFLGRQLNDQDKMKEIKEIATTITKYIKLNEGEEEVEWKKHSIYKVPATMVAVNLEAFTPKVVSMGPYHHGKDHLKPMEVYKQKAARCFIRKSGKSTEDYIEALWEVLPTLMDSYSQLDPVWMGENRRKFLELMLIDGCFLLETLLIGYSNRHDYEEHDPIFSLDAIISFHHILYDLMMLENQVPFTAVERILTVQNSKTPEENCKFISNLMSVVMTQKQHPDVSRGLHMLDVVRKVFIEQEEDVLVKEKAMAEGHKLRKWYIRSLSRLEHSKKDTQRALGKTNTAVKSRSVMELCGAGVEFKAADDGAIAFSTIKFENGVLTIPIIRPCILLEVFGCNMVAFEGIHQVHCFTTLSYFSFLSGLLTTGADVRHLRSLKIIQSTDLSDDAIVETFKRLAMDNMAVNTSNLYQGQDQLNDFYMERMTGCKSNVWEWIASWKLIWIPNLKQKYLKNPWTFISVVAATILMALLL